MLEWPWLEAAFLTIPVSATFLASTIVCRNADRIKFNNEFSRQHAFPADKLRARATFVMHFFILVLFFLPSVLYVIILGNDSEASKNGLLLLCSLMVGILGFFGMIHHFIWSAHGNGMNSSKIGVNDDI